MKAFKKLSIKEQKARYLRGLARELSREKARLRNIYSEEFEQIDKYEERISRIRDRITHKEDVVANRADRQYGGWRVWRNNKKHLARVVADMGEQTKKLRQQIMVLKWRIDIIMDPFNQEHQKLNQTFLSLSKTV